MSYRIISIASLALLTFVPVSQLTAEPAFDWSKPETIDPYEEGISDFLDTDVNELAKRAFETYQTGEYEECARYHLALLRLNITDAATIYNLACCYGLLGKDSLAARNLVRAFKAGLEDIDHAKRDRDFEKVRDKAVFASTVDSLAEIVLKKQRALGKVVRVDAPALFKCHVQVPADYDSSKSYPLLVGLHGLGATPESFIRLWERFDNPQFVYISPQAPYPYPVGNELGYTWHLWEAGREATSMSADYVLRVVESLKRTHAISDVYLFGFSQGCGHAFITGIENHQLFKGLVCFGGWLDQDYLTEETLKAGKDLRVFIAHGRDDRSVEFESGVKARETLEKHGYDVTFHEFEGGHQIPQDPLRKAQKWMFE